MKVEPCSYPTDNSAWRDRYLRLREPAEAVLACNIDLLWHLSRLRTLLPEIAVVAMDSLRTTLDDMEVALYPQLLARTESEAVARASKTDALVQSLAQPVRHV